MQTCDTVALFESRGTLFGTTIVVYREALFVLTKDERSSKNTLTGAVNMGSTNKASEHIVVALESLPMHSGIQTQLNSLCSQCAKTLPDTRFSVPYESPSS